MAAIAKTSVKEQVYDTIKQMIFDQEFAFGDTINITALSRELGISNTPIREALSRLEAEGLVTITMGSKAKVIDLDEKIISEISHSFFILIFGAYSLCAVEEKCERLLALLNLSIEEQKTTFSHDDYGDFITKAIAFDRCFVVATENEKMLSIYDSLAPLLYLMAQYNHQKNEGNRLENLRQHEAIRDAVSCGDTGLVRDLIFKHFDKHF